MTEREDGVEKLDRLHRELMLLFAKSKKEIKTHDSIMEQTITFDFERSDDESPEWAALKEQVDCYDRILQDQNDKIISKSREWQEQWRKVHNQQRSEA